MCVCVCVCVCVPFNAFDMVTKLDLEDRGFAVRFRVGKRDFIIHYYQAQSGHTKPPTRRVSATLSVVVKRPWRRPPLSPSSADVKTGWTCTWQDSMTYIGTTFVHYITVLTNHLVSFHYWYFPFPGHLMEKLFTSVWACLYRGLLGFLTGSCTTWPARIMILFSPDSYTSLQHIRA